MFMNDQQPQQQHSLHGEWYCHMQTWLYHGEYSQIIFHLARQLDCQYYQDDARQETNQKSGYQACMWYIDMSIFKNTAVNLTFDVCLCFEEQ